MAPRETLSIWFFVGLLTGFYGLVILLYGLYSLSQPPAVSRVLSELHADIWWGALLLIFGAVYIVKFAPRREP